MEPVTEAAEAGSVTPVRESTETDGVQVNQGLAPIKDEHWRSMKAIIDTIYNHKEAE